MGRVRERKMGDAKRNRERKVAGEIRKSKRESKKERKHERASNE